MRNRRSQTGDGWLVDVFVSAPGWAPFPLAAAALGLGAIYRNMPLGVVVAIVLLLAGLVATQERARRRHLVERSNSLAALRQLPWRQFEDLVAEAYRRSGYGVSLTGAGADGGADIILRRQGRTTLVQCKRHSRPLPPNVVRELHGVVVSERADDGIIVALGGVGVEGHAYARRNGIRVVDGDALLRLLGKNGSQVATRTPLAAASSSPSATPSCPRCHASMVRRHSQYGWFWGCSRFPNCRGTVDSR